MRYREGVIVKCFARGFIEECKVLIYLLELLETDLTVSILYQKS